MGVVEGTASAKAQYGLPKTSYKISGHCVNKIVPAGTPGCVPVLNIHKKQMDHPVTGEPMWKVDYKNGIKGKLIHLQFYPKTTKGDAMVKLYLHDEGDKDVSVIELKFTSPILRKFFAVQPNIDLSKPFLIKAAYSKDERSGYEDTALFISQGEVQANGFMPSVKYHYTNATPHDRPLPEKVLQDDGSEKNSYVKMNLWHLNVRIPAIQAELFKLNGTTSEQVQSKDADGNAETNADGTPKTYTRYNFPDGHPMGKQPEGTVVEQTSGTPFEPNPGSAVTPASDEDMDSDDLPF